ncbi:hypothetical protein HKX48_008821 [Thoreauomyces humboldtii]|nr:hypothetical protein HKX48_008821 [Thoreauomyces humboldtii]
MLDNVTVLTRGGIVLWSKAFSQLAPQGSQNNPIDHLLRNVLIQEQPTSADGYSKDSYQVKWAFANELGLIFVIVYQKILQLAYVEDLLEGFKRLFCVAYEAQIADASVLHDYSGFEKKFDTLLGALEAEDSQKQKTKAPRQFKDTKGFQNTLAAQNPGSNASSATSSPGSSFGDLTDAGSVGQNGDKLDEKLQALGLGSRRGGKGGKPGGRKAGPKRMGSNVSNASGTSVEGSPLPTATGKVLRSWDGHMATSAAPSGSLDYSDSKLEDAGAVPQEMIGTGMGQRTRDGLYDASEMDARESDDSEDEDDAGSTTATTTRGGGIFGFFQNLTASKVLTREDLEPVMAKMREHMINKNVASDVADHLCKSVTDSLVGQKLGKFSSLLKTIKTNLEPHIRKILTPRTSTDLLRDIFAAQSANRPYTITFVGVNGVGKSTNLSKICFWLLQNNLKVLIAACDTFRSGAVEQLRVHVRNLGAIHPGSTVQLFDRGYGKDPAGIAKDAITFAAKEGFDVVLVDTAGRMQDNEPLMRALAKLVTTNDPDKIIFVGEALVGNEAVDQLTKFNQALKDFSGVRVPRQIDGIVLSKFDTVDDKVGAALSMTYTTGQPILFVGTGQTYTDLRKMNVRSIVNSLLAK